MPSQGIEGGEAEFERPEHLPEGDYYELKRRLKPKDRIIVHCQGWFPVTLRGAGREAP